MRKTKRNQVPIPPVPVGRIKKLSRADVYKVRTRFVAGETKTAMAEEFGVSIPTISDAIHGRGAYADV